MKKFILVLSIMIVLFQPTQAQAADQFDLRGQGVEIMREKALKDKTVLQGIAFDYVNQHMYTVQVMHGGQRLPDEKAAVSGAERAAHGDLTLTKLDMDGNPLGYMYLRGFGHGVSIGVEPSEDEVHIWTETDAVQTSDKNGWGERITRFSFQDKEILDAQSSELERFGFLPGSDHTTVNLDIIHNKLTLRYRKNGTFHFALYDLKDVKQHRFQPLAEISQPQLGTVQGFATYGNYLYLYEGNNYGVMDSKWPQGNTHITTMDWQTGAIVNKQAIGIASDLPFREPEGMGVYVPEDKNPRGVLLCIGFASVVAKNNPNKLANIYGFPLIDQ